jgi:hypothetical protein
MLLSFNKPVKASSTFEGYSAKNSTDENIKTFWVAAKNDSTQWLEIDLQKPSAVHAIQLNYHDFKSDLYSRVPGLYHRYVIEGSTDGKRWSILVDKSQSFKDVPNHYVELGKAETVRYIRYKNIHVPTPNLAISGLRVFGSGQGKAPRAAKAFHVKRLPDRRDAIISWKKEGNVQGHNILWGIAPDKLYNSWMVYNDDSLHLKSLGVDQIYYFSIEAFNENGISKRSAVVEVR